MGRRGPPPEPKSLRLIKGTEKKKETAPQPPRVSAPLPPLTLIGKEKHFWNSTCARLDAMQMLTDADLNLVARYAQNLAELEKLRQVLRKKKGKLTQTFTGPKGNSYEVKLPELARLEYIETLLIRQEKELGLTPASRTGMKVPAGKANQRDEKRERLYRGL